MASVTQLGYIGISVSNIEEWEHFATEVLGLQSNGVGDDGNLTLRMDEYSQRFVLSPGGKDDIDYVGFQVTDQPALQEMTEQLRQAGVEVTMGTPDEAKARKVEGLIKFDDPEGTPTEVYYGPPISFDRPFNSPRAISGFVTGEQGLGHVVYHVENLDRAVAFLPGRSRYEDQRLHSQPRLLPLQSATPHAGAHRRQAPEAAQPFHGADPVYQRRGRDLRFGAGPGDLDNQGSGPPHQRSHDLFLHEDPFRVRRGIRVGSPHGGRHHLASATSRKRQHLGPSPSARRCCQLGKSPFRYV